MGYPWNLLRIQGRDHVWFAGAAAAAFDSVNAVLDYNALLLDHVKAPAAEYCDYRGEPLNLNPASHYYDKESLEQSYHGHHAHHHHHHHHGSNEVSKKRHKKRRRKKPSSANFYSVPSLHRG